MIISREDLGQIANAHGRVGKFNEAHWSKLVEQHELAAVLAAIDELWLDTDAEVTAAQVDRALGGIGMARVRAGESDELEQEPSETRSHERKGGAAAPVVKTVSAAAEADTQPIQQAAPAVVTTDDSHAHPGDGFPASTTAAGDAPMLEAKRTAMKAPWGLTPLSAILKGASPEEMAAMRAMKTKPTNQETDMATIKQLVAKVEAEIKRRGIHTSKAMKEIGVAATAIYAWRKGQCSENMHGRISIWLLESEKKSAASGDADEPAPVRQQRKKRQTPPVTETLFDSFEKQEQGGDLIARGADLADRLKAFGCEGYATTVTELVEIAAKWRTIQAALSA